MVILTFQHNPRFHLFVAAGLDFVGQLFVLIGLAVNSRYLTFPIESNSLSSNGGWFLFCLFLYPALGWLFGTYTVLRWRRVPLTILLQRIALTIIFVVLITAIAGWIFRAEESIWFLHRRVQFQYVFGISIWSLLVRLLLRRGNIWPESQKLLIIASDPEAKVILRAWRRVPQRSELVRLSSNNIKLYIQKLESPCLLAIGTSWKLKEANLSLMEELNTQDPRRVQIVSPVGLFDRHQERLPPVLLDDGWLNYDEIPWNATFGLQTRIKRASDLCLASLLLLISSPLIAIAMAWIWIDDPGPVFFRQVRTGLMGIPFTIVKLRTMQVQPKDAPDSWTQLRDNRITFAGRILRKLRIDELPQLFNVLTGEMSLIGPRPERPSMEKILEDNIPHYRMRHWMRPGLSGWAQVCAPYASSIEDSDLKLSYDLYYLKHFNIFLDLVILARTIKTILKASGR